MFVLYLLKTLSDVHRGIASNFASVKSQLTAYGVIMQKLVKVDVRAIQYVNVGYLTNNISSDILRIHIFIATSRSLVVGPLMVVIFLVVLLVEVGVYSLAGIGMIALLFGLTILIGKLIAKATQRKLGLSSTRNKETTFAIVGMKSIKFNCWEPIITAKINSLKRQENASVFVLNGLRSLSQGLYNVIPTVSAFVIILLYNSLNDQKLPIDTVFFVLAIFNTLITPLLLVFFAYSNLEQVRVSLDRIQKLLSLPDFVDRTKDAALPIGEVRFCGCSSSYGDRDYHRNVLRLLGDDGKAGPAKSANKYSADTSRPPDSITRTDGFQAVLKSIDLAVSPGSLTMVVGPVGSGKSSLFKTLLNETHVLSGTATYNGTVAYLGQESFLLNNLLRHNITFGKPFDADKYQRVISACELAPDIKTFKAGDLTEIGENGINLSGGQKQRICIARAMYIGADIFLVDDCLSALDAHVGKRIFERVFKALAARGKTVILNTHVLSFLEEADKVVFMKQGRIQSQGTYHQLLRRDAQFREFISAQNSEPQSSGVGSDRSISETRACMFDYSPQIYDEFYSPFRDSGYAHELADSVAESNKPAPALDASWDGRLKLALTPLEHSLREGKITKQERKETGAVRKSVYLEYFASGGVGVFVLIIVLFVIVTVSSIFSDYWISVWTSGTFGLSESTYVRVYAGILGFLIFVNLLRGAFFGWYVVRTGLALFESLISRIVKKPMQYFDTTPIGQLLNLTSKDSDYVDTYLASQTSTVLDGVIRLAGILVMAGIANYFLVVVAVGECFWGLPLPVWTMSHDTRDAVCLLFGRLNRL